MGQFCSEAYEIRVDTRSIKGQCFFLSSLCPPVRPLCFLGRRDASPCSSRDRAVARVTLVVLRAGEAHRMHKRCLCDFPHYVAGTGISSMVSGHGRYMAWALPLAVLPVMFGIYRSYRVYFGNRALVGSASDSSMPALARQQATGAV